MGRRNSLRKIEVDAMTVLVTGGAGFIGTHLCTELVASGYSVRILDNFHPQIHTSEDEAVKKFVAANPKVEIVKGDICKKPDVASALDGIKSVVHLAAETGTGQSMYEVSNCIETNVSGTANLLEQLLKQGRGVQHLLVASSRAVYGEGKYICKAHGVVYPDRRNPRVMASGIFEPLCQLCEQVLKVSSTDEESLKNPTSVYGISKLTQEQLAITIGNSAGIPVSILRFQNVFGAGQSLRNPYTGILSIFSRQFMENQPVYIFEDGQESRDFIYVSDVVAGISKCISKVPTGSRILNLGSGKATTVLDVANQLRLKLQSDSEVSITGEYRSGDIRHCIADIQKASNTIGFQPLVSFEDGISRFIEWAITQPHEDNGYANSLTELRAKGLLSQ